MMYKVVFFYTLLYKFGSACPLRTKFFLSTFFRIDRRAGPGLFQAIQRIFIETRRQVFVLVTDILGFGRKADNTGSQGK